MANDHTTPAPRPVPSDDDVRDLVEMIIRISHALGVDADVLLAVVNTTWDLYSAGASGPDVDDVIRMGDGDAAVLVSRAYRVVIDTYHWTSSTHDDVSELISDGDDAND